MNRMRACSLVCSSVSRQTRLWMTGAGTEVAFVPSSQEKRKDGNSSHFCMPKSISSMQLQRWRVWGSQGHLHSGQKIWWTLGSNHITWQDEKVAHARSSAPSLTSKKCSLDEFSRPGSTGLSSPLETTPRCPPRYDGKQSCVSLLACKCASGLTMFYHWQQCKMLLKEHSVH